jgi:hypothetical protein
MASFTTEHIHSSISTESVGHATGYRVVPEAQYVCCSLSHGVPLVAPSPGVRPYNDELPHASVGCFFILRTCLTHKYPTQIGQKVMVRRFDFASKENNGLGTWRSNRSGTIVDCGLTATSVSPRYTSSYCHP